MIPDYYSYFNTIIKSLKRSKFRIVFCLFGLSLFVFPQTNFAQRTVQPDIEWRCFLKRVIITGRTNVNTLQFTYFIPFDDSIPPGYGTPICKADTDLVIYKIPVLKFEGENQMMLEDFRNLLKAEKYPIIQIQFKRIIFRQIVMGTSPGLFLQLTLAGTSNTIPADYMIKNRTSERILISGHANINLTDFGLTPPEKLFGMIQVRDLVTIEFDIILRKNLRNQQ